MEAQLLFLNGNSLTVDLTQGFEAVTRQAANILGVAPKAIALTAFGQRLTQEMFLQWVKGDLDDLDLGESSSICAVVDQDRLQLAGALEKLDPTIQQLKEQSAKLAELRRAWNLREKELPCLEQGDCQQCIRKAERSLQERSLG